MVHVFTDAASQKIIDREIAALEVALCALKTRRNTCTAVAHLPDDILSSIFLEIHSDASYPWFRINQVCNHWRKVAVNTAQLWTKINMNHAALDWSKARLQRANSAPVDVKCYLPYAGNDPDTFWSLARQLMSSDHHIRTLDLQTTDFEALTRFLIGNAANSDASFLEHVQIFSRLDRDALPRLGNWLNFPKLKRLYLSFVSIPTIPSVLPSLTHLRLISNHIPATSVIRALDCMPVIEDVYISSVSNDDEDPPTQPTFLPALKQMNITFKDSHSGRLFDSLELPLSASVTIFFAGLRRQDVQPVLISALATRLYDGMLEIRLELEADTLKTCFVSEVNGGERSLTFPHYKDTTNIVPIFNDLPIETFTTLSLKVTSHIEVIEQLLRRFIRVKHLKIEKYSDKSLLMRLLQTDTRSPPPLRKLQSLSVDFYLAEHISLLWELLSERRDLDIPIQTILTEKSNEKHVSNLQEEFGVTVCFI